jgi:hypothetical protein
MLLQLHTQTTHIMTDQQISEKRTAPATSSSINSLIAAANKDDRFKLLEDDRVPAANLDNTIHPVFSWLACDGPMKQMLLLASQLLAHDSTLVFFIPLLYGRELTKTVSNTTKTYLSDPLADSDVNRGEMIAGVRQALYCLAHTLELRFTKPEKRVYARTLASTTKPLYSTTCCTVFQRRVSAIIEIADRFVHFYDSDDGYKTSSRSAQFRHDFLFASTLVHEIVHAVGVMRRGNLIEPCIRVGDPDPEWGYAWEHFMFGCVINPQDRTQPGTNLLMRKIWADPKRAEEGGGKEYSDVSVAYIAQWFRKETWDTVERQGPTAIPPPITHFKIQSSRKHHGWIVSTGCIDIKPDIVALQQQWIRQCRKHDVSGHLVSATPRMFWRFQTTKALQSSNVPMPLRPSWQSQDHQNSMRLSCVSVPKPVPMFAKICPIHQKHSSCSARKRKAQAETEGIPAIKIRKT